MAAQTPIRTDGAFRPRQSVQQLRRVGFSEIEQPAGQQVPPCKGPVSSSVREAIFNEAQGCLGNPGRVIVRLRRFRNLGICLSNLVISLQKGKRHAPIATRFGSSNVAAWLLLASSQQGQCAALRQLAWSMRKSLRIVSQRPHFFGKFTCKRIKSSHVVPR